MSATIIYRRAVEADVNAIARLLTDLNLFEGHTGDVKAEPLAQQLFGSNRAVDLRAVVAVDNGKIIGTLVYYPGYDILTAATGYHLGDMMVSPDYQRQGIGRGIMAYVAEENLREGGEWVSFTVLEKNKGANQFHASSGMRLVPVNFYSGGKRTLSAMIEKYKDK